MLKSLLKLNTIKLISITFLSLLVFFFLILVFKKSQNSFNDNENSKLRIPAFSGNILLKKNVGFMIGGWINVDKKDLMTSSTLRITDCGQTVEDLGKIKNFKPRSYFPISKHNDLFYITGGFEFNPPSNVIGDFWSSNDLKNWDMKAVDANWERREAHATVSHNDSLFLFGGVTYFVPKQYSDLKNNVGNLRNFNDVWIFKNNKWKLLIENAPWQKRRNFGYGSLGEYIYLWGGINDETKELFNDVWRTKDGVKWEKILNNADWGKRMISNHINIFNNRMWVMGGNGDANGINPLNDLWSSEDGINWRLEMKSFPFSGRIGSSIFNFICNNENFLFVYGGIEMDKNGDKKFMNDAWRISLTNKKNSYKEVKNIKLNFKKLNSKNLN